MTNYQWSPIEPLTDKERAIDLAGIEPLYASWRAARARLQEASPDNLRRFTDRLVRSLSIETGILERIYDLDRGTTEALILHGFVEDLVSHSSTNIEPALLIDILRDQEAATRLVLDYAAHKRELTRGLLHELHAILTRHQATTRAIDPQGNRREISLRKGAFKEHPNNPQRLDGTVHEYCPPVHVDAEIDNLLAWFREYDDEDPIVVAAWLHHRFTQIHPYQDGNGRVARALITLVLLRAGLLPLVIDRDLRSDYLGTLEAADAGESAPLVDLLASLEKKAILQALSIDIDAEVERDKSITRAVLESLAAKFQKRAQAKNEQLRQVDGLAYSLRGFTRELAEANLRLLSKTVAVVGDAVIHVTEGGPDRGNSHWYKADVVESISNTGKWVNFEEAHIFLKLSIRVDDLRLTFVTSFHHIGRQLSGIMEVTSFCRIESFEEGNEPLFPSQTAFVCSLEPFVVTWNTEEEKVRDAYRKWWDAGFAIAVKEWGDRL